MGTGVKTIHSDDSQDFETNIRVMAGPGAGKTYWLIGQLRQILSHSTRLGNCRKAAVITYTNKATENICKQIQFGMDRIEVSTIHAFLYANVIKPYFHLIADKFGFDISKLDGHDDTIVTGREFINSLIGKQKVGWLFDALKKKNKSINYNEVGNYIAKYRWTLYNDKAQLCQQGRKYNLYGAIDGDFVNAYKKDVWNQKGIMHDDDVLYFSYQLFEIIPKIKKLVVNKFPYILVDEYQDSSSIQHYLIQQLSNAGCLITVIGDEAQSIYSFANGNINFIKNIQLPNLQSYHIEDNRRSTKEIVDFLNIIRPNLQQNSIRKEHSIKPQIVIGSVIDACSYSKQCSKDESIVTLSRQNETANDLRSQHMPNFKTTHLIDDIQSLGDFRSRMFIACINAIENARQMLMKDALKEIAKGFGLDMKKIKNKKKAVMFLRTLLEEYNEFKSGDGIKLLDVVKNKLHQNIAEVRSGKPKELYSHSYSEFAKEVRYKDNSSTDMTIHKAKGLEFKNVIVVFGDEQAAVDFLLSNDLDLDSQIAEEHRIYYVACSRACDRLFLSIPSLSEVNKRKIENKFNDKLQIRYL